MAVLITYCLTDAVSLSAEGSFLQQLLVPLGLFWLTLFRCKGLLTPSFCKLCHLDAIPEQVLLSAAAQSF